MIRRKRSRRAARWITKMVVWNWKARRYIRRRDGKPFRFPIF